MDALKIIGLSVVAAIVFGIVHDQVTVRVCIEYFTIGHPPVFATDSPTLLGLGWGIIATWWVGLLLGAPLAFAAIRGPRPRRSARSLIWPIAMLLACMGVVSLIAGVIGFVVASSGWVVLVEPLASRVPSGQHVPFIADLWAHSASYLAGFVGGIILINRVWRSRRAPPYDPAQQGHAAGRPQASGG
ncbi:MAG: hypothetical protein ACT4PU_01185 [Planctomycetota bacterium]